jgi:hypothetical protein
MFGVNVSYLDHIEGQNFPLDKINKESQVSVISA